MAPGSPSAGCLSRLLRPAVLAVPPLGTIPMASLPLPCILCMLLPSLGPATPVFAGDGSAGGRTRGRVMGTRLRHALCCWRSSSQLQPTWASPGCRRCCLPREGCAGWRGPRQGWHLSPGLQRELLFFLLFSKATGRFTGCHGLA